MINNYVFLLEDVQHIRGIMKNKRWVFTSEFRYLLTVISMNLTKQEVRLIADWKMSTLRYCPHLIEGKLSHPCIVEVIYRLLSIKAANDVFQWRSSRFLEKVNRYTIRSLCCLWILWNTWTWPILKNWGWSHWLNPSSRECWTDGDDWYKRNAGWTNPPSFR